MSEADVTAARNVIGRTDVRTGWSPPGGFSIVTLARIGGLIYLAIIALGLFGEVAVRGALVVSGDAAQTASNILASETLWRAGIVGDLLMHVLDVPLIVILYLLLEPAGRTLAWVATAMNVVQTCVLATNKLTLLVPILLVPMSARFGGLTGDDLSALSYFAIKLHGHGFGVGLVFFGVASIVRGWLIFRCGYLPRALGAMLAIAGICYLVNSFALLLAPALAAMLFPLVLLPAFVGELALCLWLIVKGVDADAWNAARRRRPG